MRATSGSRGSRPLIGVSGPATPTRQVSSCSWRPVRTYSGNQVTRLRLTCEEECLMGPAGDFSHIPIIDVSDLVAGGPSKGTVAGRLGEACRESGFFYVVGHGVEEALQTLLRELSREFFA